MADKCTREFVIATTRAITLVIVALVVCSGETSRIYGNYSGDIVLAAYFPVHGVAVATDLTTPTPRNGAKSCGKIQEQDGIQVSSNSLFQDRFENRNNLVSQNLKGISIYNYY